MSKDDNQEIEHSEEKPRFNEKIRGKDGKYYPNMSQSSKVYCGLRQLGSDKYEAYKIAKNNNKPNQQSVSQLEGKYQASLLASPKRINKSLKKLDQILKGTPNVFKNKDKEVIKIEYPSLKLQADIASETIAAADGRLQGDHGDMHLHPVDLSIYIAPAPQDMVIEGEALEEASVSD